MNNIFNRQLFVLCLCLMLHTPVLNAATHQSHNSIYQAAKEFITKHATSKHGKRPEIKMGSLDSRLKLRQCEKRLTAFLPRGGRDIGKTTVGVKCSDSKPWSLNVPVSISIYKQVLVAARQIQKGTIISENDIKLARYDLASLSHGHFEALNQGVGMKLKRRMSSGTVLTPGMLKKPQVISRGQSITILAQSGNMQVRMMGKALASGAIGERISVINTKSKKKLEGIVTGSGEVKVDI